MWNTIIINPMVNVLLWLYGVLGQNYLLAILALTILIRVIIWPLTWTQLKSTSKMQEMQPQLKKLNEKYKDDPQMRNQKTMEFYREAGINPMGGCLPTIIQFPILIGLYQAIIRSLASSPLQLINLSQHIYHNLPPALAWLPDAASLLPLKSQVLWLDLARPDPTYILTVFVVLTTLIQQRLLTPPTTDPNQQSMMKSMQLIMPIMIGVYSIAFPSGLAIYWVTGNLFGIAQYTVMGRANFKNLLGTQDGKFSLSAFLGLPGDNQEEEQRPAGMKRSSNKKKKSSSSRRR